MPINILPKMVQYDTCNRGKFNIYNDIIIVKVSLMKIYFVITVTTMPSISSCLVRASVMEGSVEDDYVEANCQNVSTDTVYTNLRLNKIKVCI